MSEIEKILGTCRCSKAHRDRGLTDAMCVHCQWGPEVQPVLDDNARLLALVEEAREALVWADSELSAIAHGRPPSKKELLVDLYTQCRKVADKIRPHAPAAPGEDGP